MADCERSIQPGELWWSIQRGNGEWSIQRGGDSDRLPHAPLARIASSRESGAAGSVATSSTRASAEAPRPRVSSRRPNVNQCGAACCVLCVVGAEARQRAGRNRSEEVRTSGEREMRVELFREGREEARTSSGERRRERKGEREAPP